MGHRGLSLIHARKVTKGNNKKQGKIENRKQLVRNQSKHISNPINLTEFYLLNEIFKHISDPINLSYIHLLNEIFKVSF